MRILVTGGGGFIGSHTVDALLAEGGHELAVLDNLSSGKREQVNPAARLYRADLRDRLSVAHIVERERPALIFHLAAQMDVRQSVADPAFDADVNLIGFLNLIEAARQNGLERIIFSSTGGAIYGEQQVYPCDEDHPLRPLSPYGVAKLATERYLLFYKFQYGIDYIALRYANVYGPRQDPHGEAGVVAIFCAAIVRGQRAVVYGDGEQTRDYVYVEDVVRANLAALHSGASGEFNIGTGVETSVNQLHRELAAIAGTSLTPSFAAERAGEQRRSAISPARAKAALGWAPRVELREGLARTYAYVKERAGKLK